MSDPIISVTPHTLRDLRDGGGPIARLEADLCLTCAWQRDRAEVASGCEQERRGLSPGIAWRGGVLLCGTVCPRYEPEAA